MTVADVVHRHQNAPNAGASLYLFSVSEYLEMASRGIFHEDDPIELIEGVIAIKSDIVPPFGIPVGLPPPEIWPHVKEWGSHPLRRVTVPEYAKMLREGILDPGKRHELIEGWVVEKMSRNPPHDYVLSCIQAALASVLPANWYLRTQMGATLDESTPEPHAAVVIWPRSHYQQRHPNPSEIGLLVEVSDSTLALDLGPKLRSYARNHIYQVWVADLPNQVLHVFSKPSGPTDEPSYEQHARLNVTDRVSLNILDKMIGDFAVRDLFGLQD